MTSLESGAVMAKRMMAFAKTAGKLLQPIKDGKGGGVKEAAFGRSWMHLKRQTSYNQMKQN